MPVSLFVLFFRIGITTFGGGYAMLPILQKELIDTRQWIGEQDLADYYAISQCTPGVIAVNVATLVGYRRAGVLGAVCATAGVVCPSLLIITLIAAFFQQFATLTVVRHAFAGIRIAVCAIALRAVLKMAKKSVVDGYTLAMCLLALVGIAVFHVPVLLLMGTAAVAGLSIRALEKGRAKR